jgi:hypothetical protein
MAALRRAASDSANLSAEADDERDEEALDDEREDEAVNQEDEEQAEGDEEEPDAEDEEEKPAASAGTAIKLAERRRCLAILTHGATESNPEIAAELIMDGTSATRAARLLDAAGKGKGTNSLASRMSASQGSKRPGQDAVKRFTGPASASDADKKFVEQVRARRARQELT